MSVGSAESASGNRRFGRGPSGDSGRSPYFGRSVPRRFTASPRSTASAASSGLIRRTPSDGLVGGFSDSSSGSNGWSGIGEQLLLLGPEGLLDARLLRVDDLVELLFGPGELVARQVAVLLEGVELVAGGPPEVPQADAALLGHVAHHLHVLLAPLGGELRDGEADRVPVVAGVEPEVGLLD